MTAELVVIVVSVLAISALLTGLVRKLALSQGVLDVPNERSSHVVPTPRGGGVAIVIATTLGVFTLALRGGMDTRLLLAVAGGGLAVATVGYIDDRRSVSAGVRLAVHFIAALWALGCLGGLPPIRIGDHVLESGWAGNVLGALGIAWTINLFNFMDGIDGLAGSESLFIAWAGALLALVSGVSGAAPAVSTVFGAACLGFLLWNWPPAKIFMGDAGSGYLGYMVAVIAIAAGRDSQVAPLVTLIAGGAFFVDATLTMLRRLVRGERVHRPHRTHAYQWLARRWGSHRRVTLLALAVNVLWLLPCAWLATMYPSLAGWILLVAWAPIVGGVVAAGAGRPEPASTRF